MDPQRWTRIESLYHAALKKGPGEREGYLAEACVDEPELKREVESLLACADTELKSPMATGERWPSGFRAGSYEIIEALGAGGMGEVYRARDIRLRREVAIKTLPREFQNDPARLARFEREAQVLASLNHPGIASIYGVEERALIMELVPGPTLADRIARGRIPVEEVEDIIRQLTEALEYAHDRGVVHRDLKPANIKLDPEGKVKVLDFGLAAMVEQAAADDPVDRVNASTVSMDAGATVMGTILGTAAYMAPEQARGKRVDKRADIWAFGVVLWEMLTGDRLFQGKDTAEVLNQVLNRPIELGRAPDKFRKLLARCLDRNPKDRLRDIGEARFLLSEAYSLQQRSPAVKFLWMGAAAMLAIFAVGLSFVHFREAAPSKPSETDAVSFEIYGPANATPTSFFTISPDGRKLAFVATGLDNRAFLWIRSLQTVEQRVIDGTEGINGSPIWSPDSRYLVFGAQGKLKRVGAFGGPVEILCDLPSALMGGFFTRDHQIIYGVGVGQLALGIYELAPDGKPVALTTPKGVRATAPEPLPDGRHFLYPGASDQEGDSGIYLASTDRKAGEPTRRVLSETSPVHYVPSPQGNTGYLLFIRYPERFAQRGTLVAQRFDALLLKFTGDPVAIAEDVSDFSFSASTGVLAYRTGPVLMPPTEGSDVYGQLTWFDRHGNALSTVGDPTMYAPGMSLAPDGTRVAVGRRGAANVNLWTLEFAHGSARQVTFDAAANVFPIWSNGGKITFTSLRKNGWEFYQRAASGAGNDKLLFKPGTRAIPKDWSHDGRFLLFTAEMPARVWVLLPGGTGQERKAVALTNTPFNERMPRFSPDSHWFFYTSNRTGRDEVYVQAFDPSSPSSAAEPVRVSSNGGASARWRSDGREIIYRALDGTVMSVRVKANPVFQADPPEPLFKAPLRLENWDMTADGSKFLILIPKAANPPMPYQVVLNWTSMLTRTEK